MIRSVLLVDYDPRSVRRLRGLLQQEGMQTLLATNGDAGVQACRLCRPDLVIVQDLVPGRHGFEVCRAIKSDASGGAPPVLLLFSPRPGRRGAARSCGCDAVLDKPFDDSSFLSSVRRFLPVPEPETTVPQPSAADEPDPEIEIALDQLFHPRVLEKAVDAPPEKGNRVKGKRRASSAKRSRRSKKGKGKAGSLASAAEQRP